LKSDEAHMRAALRLARRGFGLTSPNPMVGAVLVKAGKIVGRGWHHRAGEPHAEVEAIRDAQKHGHNPKATTLFVTLEPCSTDGRTPPCTQAIIAAGIKRVVVGATDPNPRHCGKAFALLEQAGVAVTSAILKEDCERLNEAFNHWIVQRTPFATVKAAMTLDGRIATASGESKWITGEKARQYGMRLRAGADAILAGISTILADNPALTDRSGRSKRGGPSMRRIVLDARARTPLTANVVRDTAAALTTIVVGKSAPKARVAALQKYVRVIAAPTVTDVSGRQLIELRWLLKRLGAENVTSLLVEGGGEVNASFLMRGLAQRVAFFYAPKIMGGCDARRAVAGDGASRLDEVIHLRELQWRKLGPDLLMTARVGRRQG
jgi:diaminohydroxyphosphoribosylaminopyrimidine deaminase / 5-amino-6-(5-phosphoribosylamino)uracil reductase